MKRDLDLIREILVRIEESDHEGVGAAAFPSHDPKFVNYQFGLIAEAGLARHKCYGSDGEPTQYELLELRNHGHGYLASVRSDTVWAKVKKRLGAELAGATFELIKRVALSLGS